MLEVCDEKIGLLATGRKKHDAPAAVTEFNRSPLFQKSVQYARNHYDRMYFFNAKDGLLLPDQIMHPYDVSIRNFTTEEKRDWAKMVVEKLLQKELPEKTHIFLHGGSIYRKHLEPELRKHHYSVEVPLGGLGIGKQLAWYKKNLNS